jgi:hypothetical protein
MSPVPHGLSALPESDGRAIAAYFADVDHAADRSASIDAAVARALRIAIVPASLQKNARGTGVDP